MQRLFIRKDILAIGITITQLLIKTNNCATISEAHKLVRSGKVYINGENIFNENTVINHLYCDDISESFRLMIVSKKRETYIHIILNFPLDINMEHILIQFN